MKHIYEIIDDPDSEVYLKKQQKIKEIYHELALQRNAEERREQAIRDEEQKLKREFFRKEAEKNIKLKEELAKEKELLESQELKSPASDETEASSSQNETTENKS